jgi:hypothetical protein
MLGSVILLYVYTVVHSLYTCTNGSPSKITLMNRVNQSQLRFLDVTRCFPREMDVVKITKTVATMFAQDQAQDQA